MNHHEEVVTIEGYPGVQYDAVITVEMVQGSGVPTMHTTLSIPSVGAIEDFCKNLPYKYGVTFVASLSGVLDLYYVGKQGNYQQFASHP